MVNDIEFVIQRLAQSGFQPSNNGAQSKYRKNVYFIDPDGYEIEFVQYLSDIPQSHNSNE